jgi:cell division protein FtsQ
MVRKSGPSILQEDLYPSSGERVREDSPSEEIDGARLIDLDADQASPFLRAQKRVSARRSPLPRKTANRLLWGLAAAGLVCAIGLVAAAICRYGEHSWRFRIDSSDNIEVTGSENVTKAQIMEVMGSDIGRNIFFVPLAQQKAQLEQIPWVESASVMRFVPNRLAVAIQERTPVAFARVGSRMSLIDAGGTLMELTPKHKYSFPVILGMNPGEPLSTRAPRMKAYVEMVRDLDSGGAHYSQDLSEVDLSDLEDVKVRVNDPAGDVLVHLGSSEYLQRFKIYVSHAVGWRQQFQKLESVDLRYDNQIIVNPDVQRPEKVVAMTPVAGKAATPAQAVKPTALLTRMPAGDRSVPKPAFELSQKGLDSKSSQLTAKKGTSAKRKKVATKSARTAVARKLAQSGASHAALAQAKAPAASTQKVSGGQKPSPGIVKDPANAATTN